MRDQHSEGLLAGVMTLKIKSQPGGWIVVHISIFSGQDRFRHV